MKVKSRLDDVDKVIKEYKDLGYRYMGRTINDSGYATITLRELHNNSNMATENTWKEFRESGFLWWINMILHTFGWAIVVDMDDNGEVTSAYPARVKFRGFDEKNNTEGYIKVSQYMKENAPDLLDEALD